MSPAPDVRQQELFDVVRAALPEDAFVAYDVEPGSFEAVEVAPGLAAAWCSWSSFRQARWLTSIAATPDDPAAVEAAVELVVRLTRSTPQARFTGVTVPRGGLDLLPEHLRSSRSSEWDWWFTVAAPEPAPGTTWPPVVDLPGDDPRLGPLLEVASPDAPIAPGDTRVRRWAAVLDDPSWGDPADTDGTGGLVAMTAVTHLRSGVAHLNDVATHPARRGRGLAKALCGTVTRDALDEGRPAATLGMYADNDPARAVYTALGFTMTHRFTSGPLG
ncbi:MAG: GNAT family N-acetyltransferase [Candidatus Nanopelagicales bacterium]